MKPEVSTPQLTPEQAPAQYGSSPEHLPNVPTPETGIETGAERREQTADAAAVAADATLPLILPSPVVTDNTVVNGTTLTTNPAVAGDDDLIEKEWVDKAKKIVADTRDDPHAQEKAVSQLQADYVKKRYGREPSAAN